MPDDPRQPISQLTTAELDRYANQLARCLKALGIDAPIRIYVQDELATVRAEQHDRAHADQPQDPSRHYDAAGMTVSQLQRTRRELAASLALSRPGSPARAPIQAQIAAIDAELAATASSHPGGLPAA